MGNAERSFAHEILPLVLTGLLLIVLKLNQRLDLSWWMVLSPFWVPLLAWLIVGFVALLVWAAL